MKALTLVLLASTTVEAFVPAGLLTSTRRTAVENYQHQSGRLTEASSRIRRATRASAASGARRMLEIEDDDIDIDGKGEKGYTDVTVREAVEWTMSRDTEFTYVDVRSAEEHEKLSIARGAVCIPAFDLVIQGAPPAGDGGEGDGEGEEEGQSEDDSSYAPEYNFEELDYTVKPDFVDTMKEHFGLDAKLLIGCKTSRSAKACQLLVDAGFTEVYNVESQIFMRTRAPEVWS